MQRFSKYIYLPLTIIFIVSAMSLSLAWIGGEESNFGNFFSGVSFYTALIGLFLVFVHIVILILSLIVKYLKYIYLLFRYGFFISAISLLLAWLGGEESNFGNFFLGLCFYGTLISICVFFIHLVGLILSFVLKDNSKT